MWKIRLQEWLLSLRLAKIIIRTELKTFWAKPKKKELLGHWEYHENWPNPDYATEGAVAPARVFIKNGHVLVYEKEKK